MKITKILFDLVKWKMLELTKRKIAVFQVSERVESVGEKNSLIFSCDISDKRYLLLNFGDLWFWPPPHSRFFLTSLVLSLWILQNLLQNNRQECGTQIKTKIGLIRHVEQKILAFKFRRPLNLTPHSRAFGAPLALSSGIHQILLWNDRNECGTQFKAKIGLIRQVELKI